MLVGNREYLTPEELDHLYADNANGVDVAEKLAKNTAPKVFATDSFVVIDENGVPLEIKSRPNWYTTEGTLVSDEFLNSENYYNFFTSLQPEYDPYTELVEECLLSEYEVDHVNKNVTQTWKKRSLTDQEKQEYIQKRWNEIRQERNKLLSETDWTQTLDQPEEFRIKWSEYRQKLRDFSKEYNDPREVLFPRRPV